MADGNYNGGAGGAPKERAQHALNDFRFRLIGQRRLEGGTKPPTLGFNIVKDGLALNAYTNVQGDEENGRISATLPLQELMLFVTMLERCDKLQPGGHSDLDISATEFDRQANGPSAPRLKMKLRLGRNDRGVVYLEISSWKRTRPIITIEMLPSNLVRLIDGQGNPAPADKVSELVALGWAKSLCQLVPLVMNQHYVAPPPRPNSGGGGYQNRQSGGNRGGNGGGYGGGGNGGNGNGGNGGGGYGGGNSQQRTPPATDYSAGYDDNLPM